MQPPFSPCHMLTPNVYSDQKSTEILLSKVGIYNDSKQIVNHEH